MNLSNEFLNSTGDKKRKKSEGTKVTGSLTGSCTHLLLWEKAFSEARKFHVAADNYGREQRLK